MDMARTLHTVYTRRVYAVCLHERAGRGGLYDSAGEGAGNPDRHGSETGGRRGRGNGRGPAVQYLLACSSFAKWQRDGVFAQLTAVLLGRSAARRTLADDGPAHREDGP